MIKLILMMTMLSFAVASENSAKTPNGPGDTGNAETYPNQNTNRNGTGHIKEAVKPGMPETSAKPTDPDPHAKTKTGALKKYKATTD